MNSQAIFLSASVPDPKRSPDLAGTADTVAIGAAVSALVYVTLGRRLLVWGGHPAITPMIWLVAADLNVDYGAWVRLYQSSYFEDVYPEDNERFQNVKYTERVNGDRDASLSAMRQQMFKEERFESAVFIGGMGGVLDEFYLLKELQPNAKLLPIASTGGAALTLTKGMEKCDSDLFDDLDYVSLFHRRLCISVKEDRYRVPSDQPATEEERFWSSSSRGGTPRP